MTIKLNSYITFNGNTREAMEYYKSIFGGETYMDTFGSMSDSGRPVDPRDTDKIMHAYLRGNTGIELMAADTPSTMEYHDGSRMSLTLNGDDEAVLRGYWDKLAADGLITMPLDKAPWGDVFGMVTDKYGVNWMIDIGELRYA